MSAGGSSSNQITRLFEISARLNAGYLRTRCEQLKLLAPIWHRSNHLFTVCSDTCRHSAESDNRVTNCFFIRELERAMRFELTTSTLARLRSTPELRPRSAFIYRRRRIIRKTQLFASGAVHFVLKFFTTCGTRPWGVNFAP